MSDLAWMRCVDSTHHYGDSPLHFGSPERGRAVCGEAVFAATTFDRLAAMCGDEPELCILCVDHLANSYAVLAPVRPLHGDVGGLGVAMSNEEMMG